VYAINGHQDKNGSSITEKDFKKCLIYTPAEASILLLTSDFNILMSCLSFNYIGCTDSGVVET
jgi:hypothetical protein